MKKFIREYAAFNVWANERICSVASSLGDDQLDQEIISSFPSVKKTLLHLWDAQLVWINRLEGFSLKAFSSEDFSGAKEEMIEGVMNSSRKLEELADGYDKEKLNSIK